MIGLLLAARIFGVLGVLTVHFGRSSRCLLGLLRRDRVGRNVVLDLGFRGVFPIEPEFGIVARKHAVGAHLRLRFQRQQELVAADIRIVVIEYGGGHLHRKCQWNIVGIER